MDYPGLDDTVTEAFAAPVAAPASTRLIAESVAEGLDFPTSAAFADDGTLYVAESGLPFGGARPGGRIVRIGSDGPCKSVLEGLRAPVNGLVWHDGGFYISEGGFPGRISRWKPGGDRLTVLDNLPGRGNYHTNMVAVGPDGWLYFSQGAMTNSGVVGLDAYDLAWLKQLPHPSDLPGIDITLAGEVFDTSDPFAPGQRATTAAFSPFGDTSAPSASLSGQMPCTAAVLRCRPDGSELSLVAWGLRNAYGLGFLPDGRLLATDQGADDRGSRPIGNAPDSLHVVEAGGWYGWPDFVCGRPVTDPAFRPQRGPQPRFILAAHEALPLPRRPVVEFVVNAAATKFAVLPAQGWWPGQLIVAMFGDEKPMTAPHGPRAGRGLLRIDPRDWSQHALPAGPFVRPIDVVATPDGHLLVVDFGHFEMLGERGLEATRGSGKLWKIRLD
jgi:glucose/arabinose dehydrogenase